MAFICYNTKIFDIQRYMEPAHSILERIRMSRNEDSGESAQTRQSFRCSHTKSMDVDEDSSQILDL